MAEQGEEKLIAVARHIARTLGRTDTMADEVLNIFSKFDGRFSRENLYESGDEIAEPSSFRSLNRRIEVFLSFDRPIWSDSAAAASFLDAVDALISLIRELDPPVLDRADDLLQQCMLRLEEEFKTILENASPNDPTQSSPYDDSDQEDGSDFDAGYDHIPVANPVSSYDIIIDAIPPGSVADLGEISKRIADAGFGREIAHVYALSRRDFLDESLSRLGLRPKTAEEIQSTPWNLLEDEIRRWIRGVNLSCKVLFPSERQLCNRIFCNLAPIADLAFAESCRGTAIYLLDFADSVAVGSRSPERIFSIVDMYEALRDLIPDMDPLFADQFYSVYRGLGSTIKGIFTELENLIRRDPAKSPFPGGGPHPITRYVMNYLRAACASRRTLEQVMEEELENGSPPQSEDLDRSSSSLLAVQIAWILEVLSGNLEAKSKLYGNLALSSVFLMNNGRYIASKARDSELEALMGEDWMRRQAARTRKWAGDYQKATWNKVVVAIRVEHGVGPAVMAGKARMFEGYMEEIWEEQKDWVVVDERWREEMRAAAVEMVVPVYRSFVRKCRSVKYSVEEVEGMIKELFSGGGSRR